MLIAGPAYKVWLPIADSVPSKCLPFMARLPSKWGQWALSGNAPPLCGLTGTALTASSVALKPSVAVTTKVVASALVFTPIYTMVFFTYSGFAGGRSVPECAEYVQKKFLPTYLTDCSVWPIIQTINFAMVPPHLRVLWINANNILWNTFLSHMAVREE